MFTIEEIKSAHSKVKSGSDFPQYIQDIAKLGVHSYSTFVTDGHSIYCGGDNYMTQTPAKYPLMAIEKNSNKESLADALKIHQAGETDYMTFCRQSAKAGVEKWVVDIERMTCTYYNLVGDPLIVEQIPQP
ncbi:DUF1398 domain-containing protein [Flavobacterium sp. NRK1]|uniref:DUF1398 domain-containing protein n=1 Tax=Flavobacterium sp. NRK1 TaxID=2954929 RepID=UPI002093F14A|nr:DUF1398 family protein [Flavobacterium sp. NRK1]MCO6146856.1 DUF1398 domain-containing protein [Flavobacterium sp. NRK1]